MFILPAWYCVRQYKYFLSKQTHKHNATLFDVYVGLLKSGSDPDNIIPVGQKNRLVGQKKHHLLQPSAWLETYFKPVWFLPIRKGGPDNPTA